MRKWSDLGEESCCGSFKSMSYSSHHWPKDWRTSLHTWCRVSAVFWHWDWYLLGSTCRHLVLSWCPLPPVDRGVKLLHQYALISFIPFIFRLIRLVVYGTKLKLYEVNSVAQNVLQSDFIEVWVERLWSFLGMKVCVISLLYHFHPGSIELGA